MSMNTEIKQYIKEAFEKEFSGMRFNVTEGSKNIRVTSSILQVTFSKKSFQHTYTLKALSDNKFGITINLPLNHDVVNAIITTIHKNIEAWYRTCKSNIEMIMQAKYAVNWDDAPYWATYYGKDSDGEAWWFEKEPTLVNQDNSCIDNEMYFWYADEDGNPIETNKAPFYEYAIPYKNVTANVLYKRPSDLFETSLDSHIVDSSK